jgi:hypothetical protein
LVFKSPTIWSVPLEPRKGTCGELEDRPKLRCGGREPDRALLKLFGVCAKHFSTVAAPGTPIKGGKPPWVIHSNDW